MPDLLAGAIIRAGDFPSVPTDVVNDSFTTTITTFGEGGSGTYQQCAVAFMAPTTGKVDIQFAAQMVNSGANSTVVAPHVREGDTIGAGADVEPSSTNNSIFNVGTQAARFSGNLVVDGLTPYDMYNVVLEHRVQSGTGTIERRSVSVKPLS